MGPQGKEGMSYRFGERTHSRIECARSNSWGLNAETKKCRHRARRRSFSLDILSYRTVPTRPDGGSIIGFTFLWAEGWGAPQTLKRQVCQFQTVSTEGFTPGNCAHCVPVIRAGLTP